MQKSQITNGMIFELRTRSTYYVIEGMVYIKTMKHTLVPCETLWDFLEDYENDLTSKNSSSLDIVRIFDNEEKMIWSIFQIDWSKVPVDTKVLVKNSENGGWEKRHFAGFINGEVATFSNGMTSWSTLRPNNPILVSWKYAKLVPEETTTNKKIDDEFKAYCHKVRCSECDYKPRRNNKCDCHFNWLVNNYNLYKK